MLPMYVHKPVYLPIYYVQKVNCTKKRNHEIIYAYYYA